MLQKYQEVMERDATDTVTMTTIRKEKQPGKDQPIVEKEITLEKNIHFEEFLLLNESEDILVLVDEAHHSHTRAKKPYVFSRLFVRNSKMAPRSF